MRFLKIRKFFNVPVIILFCLYVLFGVGLFVFQNNFFYPADKTAFSNCSEFEKAEKIIQGDFRAYFMKRSNEKVVVYYHGNGGRACDRYAMESYFEPQGYSVLYVEYPGYAENSNTTMEKILYEVTLVDDFLKKQSFKKVVAVGESVGTGPAAYHASLKDSRLSKLILITPYNTMASVAAFHYPWYPMTLLVRNNFTPDRWLKDVTIPITLILAEKDEVVGLKQGEKLFDHLSSNNKSKYVVQGAGHNSIYGTKEFSALFLNELAK